MDSSQFDRLTRTIGEATSRRLALRGLTAGLLGAVGVGASLGEADARRRRCGDQYTGCERNKDCCRGLKCRMFRDANAEALFPGVCAYKRGCGKKNNYCRKNRDCCRKFRCRGRKCKRR